MNFTDIFVFVLGSFGIPEYYDLIKMRKLQFAKYNIPNRFLFDGPCPSDYLPDENDVFYDKPQEPFPVDFTVPYRGVNPHMIIKFLKAIKPENFNPNKYKFILRINLSTFINFPLLLNKLCNTPTSRVCISPNGGNFKTIDFFHYMIKEDYKKSCCDIHRVHDTTSCILIEHFYKNKKPEPCCELYKDMHKLSKTEFYLNQHTLLIPGMIHAYTPDLIDWFNTIALDNPNLYVHNDDVVLSFLVQKYGCQNIFIESNHNVYALDQIMTRIKDPHNRNHDVKAWRYLLTNIDNIEY